MIAGVLLAYGLVILGCVVVAVRNHAVYRYRMNLLAEIDVASGEDVHAGREWRWRYQAFDSVSYDRMVFQFWRPLSSFYPDRSFTRPEGTR